jgi:hyperosmotically inducible periplasmic protein
MKKVFVLLFLIAMVGYLGIGCRTAKNTGTAVGEGAEAGAKEVGHAAESAGKKVEDASITAAVKMKFANDETVSASRIDVDTKNGMVTLNGTVNSQVEADRAVALARTVDGVKNVNNNLSVAPPQ